MIKPVTSLYRHLFLAIVISPFFVSQFTNAAECEYIVANHWNTGFVANIRITNTGSSVLNGWEVSWQYSDGTVRTGGWNATVVGDNPYTATPLPWNVNIQPGQYIEFGVQGIKGTRDASPEVPIVTGAVCESTPTPSLHRHQPRHQPRSLHQHPLRSVRQHPLRSLRQHPLRSLRQHPLRSLHQHPLRHLRQHPLRRLRRHQPRCLHRHQPRCQLQCQHPPLFLRLEVFRLRFSYNAYSRI